MIQAMSRKNQQAGDGDASGNADGSANSSATTAKSSAVTDTRHVDDPLISLAEFARRLNKHHSTIQRWAADGLFEWVRAPSGIKSVRTSVANTFLGGTAIERRV